MVKKNIQDYYCNVISENVKIYLRNKVNSGLKYKKDYFVIKKTILLNAIRKIVNT